jgi:hypothetical protein
VRRGPHRGRGRPGAARAAAGRPRRGPSRCAAARRHQRRGSARPPGPARVELGPARARLGAARPPRASRRPGQPGRRGRRRQRDRASRGRRRGGSSRSSSRHAVSGRRRPRGARAAPARRPAPWRAPAATSEPPPVAGSCSPAGRGGLRAAPAASAGRRGQHERRLDQQLDVAVLDAPRRASVRVLRVVGRQLARQRGQRAVESSRPPYDSGRAASSSVPKIDSVPSPLSTISSSRDWHGKSTCAAVLICQSRRRRGACTGVTLLRWCAVDPQRRRWGTPAAGSAHLRARAPAAAGRRRRRSGWSWSRSCGG